MVAPASSATSRRARAWAPNLVLVASVLITLLATWYVSAEADAKDRLRLENAVQRIGDSVSRRLDIYGAILRSGRGLFDASDQVSRADWGEFVSSLNVRDFYPGVQGIGYAARVEGAEFERIASALSAERNFRVWPAERDGWTPYTAIVYLEPRDARNSAAIGFDMYSEPTRRAAMERARDSGMTTASGLVTLKQEIDENRQRGFLFYTPVYRKGAPTNTVDERRAALLGYVYCPFRAADLFEGILGSESVPAVDLAIYDGDVRGPESLLYDSRTADGGNTEPLYTTQSYLVVAGRAWTMVCSTRPGFELASGRSFASYTLVAGLLVSVLLFVVTSAQARARSAAERIATDLRRSEVALRSSESRMRRFVESNVIGIVIADFGGHVVEANDAFLQILGHTREDLEAGRVDMQRIASGDAHGFDAATLAEVKRAGVKEPFEAVYARSDGTPVPVLEGLAYLEGERDMAVGFVLDLSERKRAEEERARLLERERRAREMAENANRVKDEFLATVSHELRTPLNSILGWSRMLRTGRLDPDKTDRALESIERNARAQAQLVEDLLDVSRIITGKLRLRVQQVEFASVVEGALEGIRPAAAGKRLRLETEVDDATGVVTGDATRIQQVAWNLLSNAVKFTPVGGRVAVRVRAVDTCAELVVSDDGPGIAPEFLPHVFDRFRQEDSSLTRSHGGLGLGLAIVRHLVEMHGGTVAVDSPGELGGATFSVQLPLAGIRLDVDRDAPEIEADVAGLAGLRILVVDDDPDTRDMLAELFGQHGADVLTCANIDQAVDAVRTWPPNVLISDIAMPGGDGYELLRRVRGLGTEGATVPAIALSAFARSQDRRRSMAAGFQDHHAKPFDPARLLESVARLASAGSHRT